MSKTLSNPIILCAFCPTVIGSDPTECEVISYKAYLQLSFSLLAFHGGVYHHNSPACTHAAPIKMLFSIMLLWEEAGNLEYLDAFMSLIHQMGCAGICRTEER